MHIRLSDLRAECARNPFVAHVIQICAVTRQVSLTRFAWVQRHREARRSREERYTQEHHKELLFAFQALERSGFGRILQKSQMARARFQWAVMPVTIERALAQPDREILPAEVLPVAATLHLTLPPPEVEVKRPGWTQHEVTLRPGAAAEFWVPDDLTLPEAIWLGTYLQKLAAGRQESAPEAPGSSPVAAADSLQP